MAECLNPGAATGIAGCRATHASSRPRTAEYWLDDQRRQQIGRRLADTAWRAVELPASGVRGGVAPAQRAPIVLDGEGLVADRAAPRLGEHTQEVLAGLGYDEAERARLRAKGVVG